MKNIKILETAIRKIMTESEDVENLKKGSLVLIHGFVMLRGLDSGKYYVVTAVDDYSITFAKSGIRGNLPSITAKRVRFKKYDISGMMGTFKAGDHNGIEVIKY